MLVRYHGGTRVRRLALAATPRERRVELAFEGDRWPELDRDGLAVATFGLPEDRAYQVL